MNKKLGGEKSRIANLKKEVKKRYEKVDSFCEFDGGALLWSRIFILWDVRM